MLLVFPEAESGRPASERRLRPIRRLAFILGCWALIPVGRVDAAPHFALVAGPVATQKQGLPGWKVAVVNAKLDPGEQVRTGVSANATILFDDDSRIELGPNATFAIAENAPGRISIKLPIGFLRALISKVAGRQFQIKTPTAVCSVRGTEFTVDVNQEGHTNVQMFSGLLAVADGLGNEALIKDKQRVTVTDRGIGPVTGGDNKQTRADQRGERLKANARREIGFDMSKEQIQSIAASQAKKAVYEQGKAIIDVNGNRVRIEEYIIRPSPTDFKLVVLNDRANSFNYFWYHGTFNTALPDDISIAFRQLPGCVNSACQYFLTGFDTGRSNTIDNMLEVSAGGHPVDVNNDGVAADAVTAVFDSKTDQFVSLNVPNPGGAGNQSFFQTLYDYNKLTFDGVPHNGWSPSGGVVSVLNGGAGIQNMGGDIDSTKVANDMSSNASIVAGGVFAPATLTTVQTPPGCGPPDCTYNEAGVEHSVIYSANTGAGTWEKYDSYVISDEGKVANTADFAGATTGTAFKQVLLNFNFEQIVTASEFNGRSIDIAVAPKIFIQSGLIQ